MASPSTSFDQVKKEYDLYAGTYTEYSEYPYGIMERQLVQSALGDCTGAIVLDLGGGTGLRAHQVIEAGAVAVDVVDISSEMLRNGKEIEDSHSHADAITWYEADISKPLDHLPLRTYDLVMANWVFHHAHNIAEFESMWANVVARLKPGGRFVGVRSGDPYAPCFLHPDAPSRCQKHVVLVSVARGCGTC
ncbi:S-adenosyl-L-methionine-dependent methyltransferase [Xylariaceae sp. FL0255]|nr:S-adenosyl-L-methionine-dependent methyltransferase [Xylariaceae sp. FL0255]